MNLCHACVLHCRAATAPNQAMLDEQPTSLPVDDAFAVEEEEADRYLCCIKPGGREKEVGGDSLLVALSFRKLAKVFQRGEREWSSRG